MHQHGKGFSFHLAHDALAVMFGGAFADSKIGGDILIQFTIDNTLQHLAFTPGKAGKAPGYVFVLGVFGVRGAPIGQCRRHTF